MNRIWLVALVPFLLAACSKEEEPVVAPVDLVAGKAIAEERCAGCHGLDGRGASSEIPNLAAQPREYLADAMLAYKEGRRSHAALRDLASGMTDADINNIAGYYSNQPAVHAAEHSEPELPANTAYEEGAKVAEACSDCHGEGGFSEEPGVPSLAGQQAAYLIVSIQEYARGDRGHAEKEAMLRELEQVDIEKMALYFASQVPPARSASLFGDPVRGEPLTATCGECHGANGVSHDPLIPSLAGQQPDYLVQALQAYREGGREHEEMVAQRTDPEIEDIAAFYAVQEPQTAGGHEFDVMELIAKCDRCHNPATGQPALVVPSLDGQNREYLVRVMKAYRGSDRGNSMMHKMSAGYSDPMIEAVADHYSGQ